MRSRVKFDVLSVTTILLSRITVMRSESCKRLFQRVADEDDGDAFALEPPGKIEEVELLFRRQRRGRLVEDDDAGLVMNGARDLDHLLLAGTERRDLDGRIDIEIERQEEALCVDVEAAQAIEQLARGRDRCSAPPSSTGTRLVSWIDHGDAVVQRIGWRFQHDRLAVEQHCPGLG